MNEQDLLKRTKDFSLRVIKLVGALPNTVAGRKIGDQLLHSGTSVGANYRAACRGRSKPEFIAKLEIVEEESDESAFWMELIIDADCSSRPRCSRFTMRLNKFETSWLDLGSPPRGRFRLPIANRKSQIANEDH